MWIMTTYGFFSAVENRDDKRALCVRARQRQDLLNLVGHLEIDPEITVNDQADYRYRISVTKQQWADLLAEEALRIDYDNFKHAVKKIDMEHAQAYGEVWSVLYELQRSERERSSS